VRVEDRARTECPLRHAPRPAPAFQRPPAEGGTSVRVRLPLKAGPYENRIACHWRLPSIRIPSCSARPTMRQRFPLPIP
jgi:hypothetical protein